MAHDNNLQISLEPKLTIIEQIEKLKAQGVEFKKCSQDEAKKFLEESSYYFKISIFKKLYNKQDGRYQGLDFAYLRELANLDTKFRKVILELCLTCEHVLKTRLNKHLSYNDRENGYDIVSEFLEEHKPAAFRQHERNKTGPYLKALMNEYYPRINKFALWNFVEILSFAEFIEFLKFYQNRYRLFNTYIMNLSYICRILRNVAAHNNAILDTLKRNLAENFQPNRKLVEKLQEKIVNRTDVQEKCRIIIIHDFLAVIELFTMICPIAMKNKIKNKCILIFLDRLKQNIAYFETNLDLKDKIYFIDEAVRAII